MQAKLTIFTCYDLARKNPEGGPHGKEDRVMWASCPIPSKLSDRPIVFALLSSALPRSIAEICRGLPELGHMHCICNCTRSVHVVSSCNISRLVWHNIEHQLLTRSISEHVPHSFSVFHNSILTTTTIVYNRTSNTIYYTLVKVTILKEEKSSARSIREFGLIWFQILLSKSRCQLFVTIDWTNPIYQPTIYHLCWSN